MHQLVLTPTQLDRIFIGKRHIMGHLPWLHHASVDGNQIKIPTEAVFPKAVTDIREEVVSLNVTGRGQIPVFPERFFLKGFRNRELGSLSGIRRLFFHGARK